jgi:hemoglobin
LAEPSSATESAPPSLFERVGGSEGVRAIVWRFYALVAADPDLRPLYPADLAPGRGKLALFLQQWLGGPGTYSELHGHPRLRMRHLPFAVTGHGAGRWLRYMRQALREEGVSDEDQREIFTGLAPLAHHMVNQP